MYKCVRAKEKMSVKVAKKKKNYEIFSEESFTGATHENEVKLAINLMRCILRKHHDEKDAC
jgi:hypothetical protein